MGEADFLVNDCYFQVINFDWVIGEEIVDEGEKMWMKKKGELTLNIRI